MKEQVEGGKLGGDCRVHMVSMAPCLFPFSHWTSCLAKNEPANQETKVSSVHPGKRCRPSIVALGQVRVHGGKYEMGDLAGSGEPLCAIFYTYIRVLCAFHNNGPRVTSESHRWNNCPSRELLNVGFEEQQRCSRGLA